MSIWNQTAEKFEEGSFEPPPPGSHAAVLVAMIDLGTHPTNFEGKSGWRRQVYLAWEYGSNSRGSPFVISSVQSLSMKDKSRLRNWVERRLGKVIPDGQDYDLRKELGQPCLLSVTMRGTYAQVDGMDPLPVGMTVPRPSRQPLLWSVDDWLAKGRPELKFPNWLPRLFGEPLRDHVLRCREVLGTAAARQAVERGPSANGHAGTPGGEYTPPAEGTGSEIPF